MKYSHLFLAGVLPMVASHQQQQQTPIVQELTEQLEQSLQKTHEICENVVLANCPSSQPVEIDILLIPPPSERSGGADDEGGGLWWFLMPPPPQQQPQEELDDEWFPIANRLLRSAGVKASTNNLGENGHGILLDPPSTVDPGFGIKPFSPIRTFNKPINKGKRLFRRLAGSLLGENGAGIYHPEEPTTSSPMLGANGAGIYHPEEPTTSSPMLGANGAGIYHPNQPPPPPPGSNGGGIQNTPPLAGGNGHGIYKPVIAPEEEELRYTTMPVVVPDFELKKGHLKGKDGAGVYHGGNRRLHGRHEHGKHDVHEASNDEKSSHHKPCGHHHHHHHGEIPKFPPYGFEEKQDECLRDILRTPEKQMEQDFPCYQSVVESQNIYVSLQNELAYEEFQRNFVFFFLPMLLILSILSVCCLRRSEINEKRKRGFKKVRNDVLSTVWDNEDVKQKIESELGYELPTVLPNKFRNVQLPSSEGEERPTFCKTFCRVFLCTFVFITFAPLIFSEDFWIGVLLFYGIYRMSKCCCGSKPTEQEEGSNAEEGEQVYVVVSGNGEYPGAKTLNSAPEQEMKVFVGIPTTV